MEEGVGFDIVREVRDDRKRHQQVLTEVEKDRYDQ